MTRKSTLALIITISALMLYMGCGGEGEDGSVPPGLGGGGPGDCTIHCPTCALRPTTDPLKDVCFSLDLTGVCWSGCDLTEALLHGAKMEGANLRGANLTRANLVQANLKSAKLDMAILTDTTFFATNLRGADLSHKNKKGQVLKYKLLLILRL